MIEIALMMSGIYFIFIMELWSYGKICGMRNVTGRWRCDTVDRISFPPTPPDLHEMTLRHAGEHIDGEVDSINHEVSHRIEVDGDAGDNLTIFRRVNHTGCVTRLAGQLFREANTERLVWRIIASDDNCGFPNPNETRTFVRVG